MCNYVQRAVWNLAKHENTINRCNKLRKDIGVTDNDFLNICIKINQVILIKERKQLKIKRTVIKSTTIPFIVYTT